MKISLADVARHLKVSEATVSLALNNRAGVSAKTKQKVLEAVEQLGYSPDFFARSLAMQRSHSIGLIVPEIENPYYSKLTQNLDRRFRQKGLHLIIGFSDFSLETEMEVMTRFLNMRVEGIIISPVHLMRTTDSYRTTIGNSPVPILYLASHYDFDCNYVMTQLAEGSFLLTEHLLNQGYEQIIFLSGNKEVLLVSEREKGFHKACQSKGRPVHSDQIVRCSNFNYEEAYQATIHLLAEGIRPDAIMTINDVMALGVMRAVRESGLRIPEDIAVAGYDDVIYASIAEVPLTTVRQPLDQLVGMAVDGLTGLMDKELANPLQLLAPPQLVIRRSTLKY